MIKCEDLYGVFEQRNFSFFTGVPDSTFKDWMKFLADEHGKKVTNIIASNECEALATAAGYHLATGKIGVVYMQNSGEGKTINPLTSLCDPEVYSIPTLLMIGWRGEPGKKDEPQHKKMGRITEKLLDTLEIPYALLPETSEDAVSVLKTAVDYMSEHNAPYAIIVRKGLFEPYESKTKFELSYEMTREDAIKTIIDNMDGPEIIVSTTGKTSRELFEYRETLGQNHDKDFLTVGSMGCSSSIANGIAQQTDKPVYVFDGDGATIMQMGALATIGHYKPKNLIHIIFDNSAYDSTGGQPTVSSTVNFDQIALACGYSSAHIVESKEELTKTMNQIKQSNGPLMLIIKVKKGARKDLGRPTTTPIENKESFMRLLN